MRCAPKDRKIHNRDFLTPNHRSPIDHALQPKWQT